LYESLHCIYITTEETFWRLTLCTVESQPGPLPWSAHLLLVHSLRVRLFTLRLVYNWNMQKPNGSGKQPMSCQLVRPVHDPVAMILEYCCLHIMFNYWI